MGKDKVEIVERDGEKPLLVIKYNLVGKSFIVLHRLLSFALGVGFLLVDNAFTQVFGFFLILYGVVGLLKSLFFRKIIFYNQFLLINWNIFGFKLVKTIKYSTVGTSKFNGILGGSIAFIAKEGSIDRLIGILLFSIDLLPLTSEEIEKIKKILIEKKVIKGEEYVWSN